MAEATSPIGLFDVFRADLARVHAAQVASESSAGMLVPILDEASAGLAQHSGLLAQRLADLIAAPSLRRFTNRFLDVMMNELRGRGRRRGMAGQVGFDVMLLSYLFHIAAEAEAMRHAGTLPKFLAVNVWRRLSGRPVSWNDSIVEHMDRRVLPWVNQTTVAFIHASRAEGFLDEEWSRRVTVHFVRDSVAGIRACRPIGRHPLGRPSIAECLAEPGESGFSDFVNERYLKQLVVATKWQPVSSMQTYHDSAWTLA